MKAILIALWVGLAVGGVVGLGLGYKWGAGELAQLRSELKAQEGKVKVVELVVTEFVEKEKIVYRDKVKVVTKNLEKIVERPVYKNICLDKDGVDSFNALMGN